MELSREEHEKLALLLDAISDGKTLKHTLFGECISIRFTPNIANSYKVEFFFKRNPNVPAPCNINNIRIVD